MKLPTLFLTTLITLSSITAGKAEASQFGAEVLDNLLHHKADFNQSYHSPSYRYQSINLRHRGHRRRRIHFGNRRRHRGRHFRHKKHNVFNQHHGDRRANYFK